ncbi:pullulanase-type alpha-1,6-glucosidase [Psychrobium sp. MM17-31]|uniref:pullulanase-type alpha-1,6-glucosidase n=1 Tax=Psychrobium sp. MM17-31 TaxID=2917758 RepID=UPI001EF4CE31|nr:pullulanase-type alpha-1,6-glucosidase [Psychrobium sp. MM17-31]MCG7530877.1 pullulanase-type alpha-1,6-glucosidase [Psychrobium sp. MM17-31]
MKKLSMVMLGVLGLSGCMATTPSQQIDNTIFTQPSADFSAHWLTPNLMLLPQSNATTTVLYVGGDTPQRIKLSTATLPEAIAKQFPHLKDFQAYQLSQSADDIKQWLTQPLMVKQSYEGKSASFSQVQFGNLLDALYTQGSNDANELTDLGATTIDHHTQFKLWAPTAQQVSVLVYGKDKSAPAQQHVMTFDDKTGAWSYKAKDDLSDHYYQYQLNVFHPQSRRVETLTISDPYSLSLSTNSQLSQVVDLNDASTKPKGWDNQPDVKVNNSLDNIFYETHIRDFSASDKTVPVNLRGKYAAFSQKNSDGINHLKSLKEAGINTVHLLPAFDIGTVNENHDTVLTLDSSMKELCQQVTSLKQCKESNQTQSIRDHLSQQAATSDNQQAVVSAMRQLDNYNWGYDPYHYAVPEGSYAQDPDGSARIVEFREMVMNLHELGFRVVMDVVYNHTHQAGLSGTAVLDKIVPNYYHRLDPITGKIAQSTCCDNTATERAMMDKLMVDTLVVWARDYKIDGFRFDLMAHQPKDAMLRARDAVHAVDSDNYFYGEGWNFGEVANNQRFVQASQLELGGTQIGTFTDRLRDAVRGGAFNATALDIRKSQGIGSGLVTSPNELTQTPNRDDYRHKMAQLRIGLAGNLRHFPLENAKGEQVTGEMIPYGGQPTGYALHPADTINYVSKHDNQTLWDNNQYRLPYDMSTEDRVRIHNQSLSYAVLAQGIPFIHMGSELLRSKSFLRDSYDYGDWFNKVDFSKQSNNYNVGLPPAEKDVANWQLIKTLIANNEGRDTPQPKDIAFADSVFKEFIKIRMTNPIFRLQTADEIIKQVRFLNTGIDQQDGIIAMQINAAPNTEQQSVVVIFNSNESEQSLSFKDADKFKLHPVQQQGADKTLRSTSAKKNSLTVPALSTVVFVKK